MAAGKIIGLGILLQMLDKVTGPAAKISKAFNNVERSAGAADKATAMAQKTLSMGWKTTAIGTAMAAPFILAGKVTIGAQVALADYSRDLEQVAGKARGTKLFEWMKEFEDITPFEKGPITDAMKVVERAGLDSMKWMPRVVDVATALKKTPGEVAAMMARAVATGQGRGLWELGIDKLLLISAGLKGGLDEVVDRSRMLNVMWKAFGSQTFAGAGAAYMRTWPGLIKRAGEVWEKFIERAGGAPFEKLLNWLRRIVSLIETPAFKTGLSRWADIAGAAFSKVIDWAGVLVKPVIAIVLWIDKLTKTHPNLVKYGLAFAFVGSMALVALGGFLVAFAGIAWSVAGTLRFLSMLRFALFAVHYYAVLGIPSITAFGKALVIAFGAATRAALMFLVTNPVGWIILAVAAIAGIAYLVIRNWGVLGPFFSKIVSHIAGAFVWLWNQLLTGVNWVVSLPAKLFEAGKRMVLSIWEGIKSVAMWPVNALRNIFEWMKNLLPGSEPRDFSSPLRGLFDRGFAIADRVAVGIHAGTPRIRKAAALAAMAAVPTLMPLTMPIGNLAGFQQDIAAITGVVAQPAGIDWRGLGKEAKKDWNLSQPELKPLKEEGLDREEIGPNLGGNATGSGIITYITQHFERGSIVISADKIDEASLTKLMGRIIKEEIKG